MSDSEPLRDDRVWGKVHRLQTEWLKEHLSKNCDETLLGNGFDDPPQDGETGVVVRPYGPDRGELLKTGHVLNVPRQCVVAASRVVKKIADPPGGVGHQMADGRLGGCLFVGDPEVREVGPDSRIEVERALLGKAHRQSSGERLGDRADLMKRVVGDRQWVIDVGDAEPGRLHLAAVQDSDRDTGDAARLQCLFHELAQLCPGFPLRFGHGCPPLELILASGEKAVQTLNEGTCCSLGGLNRYGNHE